MDTYSKNDTSNLQKIINNSQKKITDPVKLGNQTLQNKIVMAALIRGRADPKNGIPNNLMKEYYSQRTGFGMIITECAPISPLSTCYPGQGGIYTPEQTEGWKQIVDEIHQKNKNAKICLQIWHSGRVALKEQIGQDPLAPSPITIQGSTHLTTQKQFSKPKEMTIQDIENVKNEFRQGAINAKNAGFDFIQLHASDGYLIDQFLRSSSNQRNDEYGGSIQKRCRFMLEVMDILIEIFGAQNTGIKLCFTGRFNGQYDENPLELYKFALKELEKKNIAFVELKKHLQRNSKPSQPGSQVDTEGRILPEFQISDFFPSLRKLYKGTIIGNGGLDPESAQIAIDKNQIDMASFGYLSITNPDLVSRVQNNQPLNTDFDFNTFFQGDSKGYTDYKNY